MSALGKDGQEDILTNLDLVGENGVIKKKKVDPIVLVSTSQPEITGHRNWITFIKKDQRLLPQ